MYMYKRYMYKYLRTHAVYCQVSTLPSYTQTGISQHDRNKNYISTAIYFHSNAQTGHKRPYVLKFVS